MCMVVPFVGVQFKPRDLRENKKKAFILQESFLLKTKPETCHHNFFAAYFLVHPIEKCNQLFLPKKIGLGFH